MPPTRHRNGRTSTAVGALLLGFVMACSDATQPPVPAPRTVVASADSVRLTALGEVRQMSATVLDQTGTPMTGVALSWTSTNTSVVTVSPGGLVTAVANGSTSVTVGAGGVSGQFEVVVAQVAASLLLSATQVDLPALTDTLRLSATVRDSGGSPIVGAPVGWASLDTMVAAVSPSGLVRAVANGTTGLLVTSGTTVATASVRVAQVPAAVVLSADSVVLASVGESVTVVPNVTDARGFSVPQASITWLSLQPTVVTAVGGLLTAVANGNALVTATAGARVDTVRVRVQQVPASIDVQPDSVVLDQPGDSAQVSVSVFDARGVAIAAPSLGWLSSNVGVATVGPTGKVGAVATGTTVVSVTAGSVTGQVGVRVVPQLTLVPASPTMVSAQVTSGVSLSVQVRDLLGTPYQGGTVVWAADPGSGAITSSTSTSSGASGHAGAVWQLGTLAGAQRATARITSRGNVVEVAFVATALPGPAATAALTADSMLLSARGETAYLSPTYRDQFANITSPGGLTWTSRNPAVASVATDGLVTGQGPGATYVVASFGAPVDSILVTVALRGAITLTFDDGFRDVYDNAWPIVQTIGLRANIGVNPAQVGFPAYMTKAHLDEMHAAGWSIVSHTMTHDTLTTHSVGELDYELRASKLWIEAQGYNGSNVFIVPFHLWGARERDAVGSYYEAARGTSANAVVPDSLATWRPPNPYALTGIDADQLPYTTQQGRDTLLAMLQRVVSEGAFLDVFFHHVPPANVAAFQQTMLLLDQFRERVIPYHGLYPRFARAVF